MKIRDGKKRHINFPYFLAGANQINKLFIKASSYEPVLRKKDKFPKSKETLFLEFPIFLTGLPGSTNFLFTRRL